MVDIETASNVGNEKVVAQTKQPELATGNATNMSNAEQKSSNANSSKVFATPAVRKLAKENNINLSLITPTGPKQRVTKEDVLLFIQGGSKAPVSSSASTKAAPKDDSVVSHTQPAVVSLQDQRVPIRGVQRLMVKSMTAAAQVSVSNKQF